MVLGFLGACVPVKIFVRLSVSEAKALEELAWHKAAFCRSLPKALQLEKAARSLRGSRLAFEHPELCVVPGRRLPLIETFAALEHEQWTIWAEGILNEEAMISPERRERWKLLIRIPYRKLPEEHKEADRIWARRVMETLYKNRVDWP
jgi:hypothetical protein